MPALKNTFLFVEPLKHYLEYGSRVMQEIVRTYRQPGQIITELLGDEANKEKIKQELQRLNPIVFVALGHGNVDVWSDECTEVFMRVGDPEVELMKDRVVHLNSCLTAQELGPAIIDAGAIAYIGSKEEFWFFTGDAPGTTRAVRSPFLAEYQFDASILQGKSNSDARQDQMRKYDEEIDYWTFGDGKDDPNSLELSRILGINKSISVFLGEGTVVPSPTRPMVVSASMLPILLPYLALSWLIYRELKH
jgi:hypothetical protein